MFSGEEALLEDPLCAWSYDCCVTVFVLLVDRSDTPVRVDKTDSKEGLTLKAGSP
jgi:hypothetical protein